MLIAWQLPVRVLVRALAALAWALAAGTGPAAAADSQGFVSLPCPAQGAAAASDLENDLCHCLSQQLPRRTLDGVQVEELGACARPLALGMLGPSRLIVLPAYLTLTGQPPSHAAFLMLRQGGAWQVADMVLSPIWTHGGPCEVRASVRKWPRTGRLQLQLQRRCNQPLDSAEVRAGAPSLALQQCRTLKYSGKQQGLHRLEANLIERACTAR